MANDTLHIGVPFEIVDETTVKAFDGSSFDVVTVKGVVTRPALDADDQVVDPEWAAKALADWFDSGANVRQMHQAKAIGRGIALERNGDEHVLTAKIADPTAVHLVREGVLHDYSIAVKKPHVTWGKSFPGLSSPPSGGILDGGMIYEVTAADRGVCPGTFFDIVKAMTDGTPEWTDALLFGFTVCDCGACDVEKAELSGGSRSALPDSAFAYVEPGHKDADGKTPDQYRHFPYKHADGSIDSSHVKNALARLEGGQSPFAGKARAKIEAAAASAGIGDHGSSKAPANDEEDVLKADADSDDSGKKCSTCKGDGKIRGGAMKCPDCDGSGKVTKAVIPADDQQVTQHLSQADTEIEAAQAAQAQDNAGHMAGKTEKAFGDPPYWVRQLHDHLCAAYDPNDVAGMYPAVKSMGQLFHVDKFDQAVGKAREVDAGTGRFADQILEASALYADAVALKAAEPELLEDVRLHVRKMFTDDYPSVHVSPNAMHPQSFTNPYVTTNRQPERPHGAPRIPSMNHVPSPDSIPGHGWVTSGRQRQPATSGGPNHPAGNTGGGHGIGGPIDSAASTMMDMHDRLAGRYPQMCPMGADMPSPANNRAGNKPQPVSPRLKATEVEDMDTAEVQEYIKAEVGTALEAALSAETMQKTIKKAVKKALAPAEETETETPDAVKAIQAENDALKARIAELDRLPAILAQSVRVPGAPVASPFAPADVLNSVEKAHGAAGEEAQVGAGSGATLTKAQVRLIDEMRAGDPDQRANAIAELTEQLEPDDLVKAFMDVGTLHQRQGVHLPV